MNENELAKIVVDTAYQIHSRLGPGLLESAYESVLSFELGRKGITVERQMPIPLVWEGMLVTGCFRADLILDGKVIVELKATELNHPVYKKQLLTYLKITGLKLGLLINFGTPTLKEGISRVVNGLPD